MLGFFTASEALANVKYLLIALFGLIGIFSRYGFNLLLVHSFGGHFPLATLLINILGSFLIGLTYVLGVERLLVSEDLRVALMSGLFGGFTTFSAFSLETLLLFESERSLIAGLYCAGNVCGGIFACVAGLGLGRWVLTIA